MARAVTDGSPLPQALALGSYAVGATLLPLPSPLLLPDTLFETQKFPALPKVSAAENEREAQYSMSFAQGLHGQLQSGAASLAGRALLVCLRNVLIVCSSHMAEAEYLFLLPGMDLISEIRG